MGNVKFHTMGILWRKLIYSHTAILWALNKNLLNLKTHKTRRYGKLVSIDFPMYGDIFSQFMEN